MNNKSENPLWVPKNKIFHDFRRSVFYKELYSTYDKFNTDFSKKHQKKIRLPLNFIRWLESSETVYKAFKFLLESLKTRHTMGKDISISTFEEKGN